MKRIAYNYDEIRFANKAVRNQFGYELEKTKERLSVEKVVKHAARKNDFRDILNKVTQKYEVELNTMNEERLWLPTKSNFIIKAKDVIGSFDIQTSIAKIRKAEEKLIKSNRIYSVLSYINQLIVRSHDQETLFSEACKITTIHGKFQFAWIGIVNQKDKKVKLVAENNAHSEDLKYFSDMTFDGKGPIAKVLRSGKYYLINNFNNVPPKCQWDHYTRNHEFLSAIFLPIKKAGLTIGTFNLFSSEVNFFDDEEISLLVEISSDISFALDVFEKEKEKKLALEKLDHSESKLKEAQSIAHVGNWEYNFNTGTALCSDEACRIYGLPEKSKILTYKSWFRFIHPEDRDHVIDKIKTYSNLLQEFSFYHRIILDDGTEKHVCQKTLFGFGADGNPVRVHGTVQDITEVKIAEQNIEFAKKNISALINNTKDSMWSVDRSGQLITYNVAFEEMMKVMTGKLNFNLTNPWEGFDKSLLMRWKDYYNRGYRGDSFTVTDFSVSPVEKWSEISFNPIKKADEVVGVACYARDITSIKKAEEEIINLNEALEEKVLQRTMELAKVNVRMEQKAQMLLHASNIIEKKNRDITDSLNYAKVIQNATVNKEGVLYKHFPDSFILNMPLHIVSGDFVRVDEKCGNVLVALADCTGHGVPGALMSMIGYSFFHDVIHYENKIIPSDVLNTIDENFKKLTYESLEINDGMDVGFCNINLNNMDLHFAGAHRPLYIVRENTLIELKGDNLSIGAQNFERKEYTDTFLKLQKNDALYMFSDGYTDQFGGEKGKKFSSKRFKEMLLSIQHLNMNEQEHIFKKTIIDWKGDLDQIDDICVLGICL